MMAFSHPPAIAVNRRRPDRIVLYLNMNDTLTDKRTHHRREGQSFRCWPTGKGPERILIIRFHALGDIAITLPASVALRSRFPNSQIDYLTSGSGVSLVASLDAFNEVREMPAEFRPLTRIRSALRLGTSIRGLRYDVIVDLQRNWVSRIIRRVAAPATWGEFDRFAPRTAGDRVIECFHKTGFADLQHDFRLPIREHIARTASELLRRSGRDPQKQLIVLNPAGLWETRNWPLENYVALAKIWNERESAQFLILGTERMVRKAMTLSNRLGGEVINLTGQTTLGEALALLTHATLVITEDSGLMHMAWAAGIPTLALFGSTYHVWSAPPPGRGLCLHSGDLPCGDCMAPLCRFGDVHCLTRFTPRDVYRAAKQLISNPRLTEVGER